MTSPSLFRLSCMQEEKTSYTKYGTTAGTRRTLPSSFWMCNVSVLPMIFHVSSNLLAFPSAFVSKGDEAQHQATGTNYSFLEND